MERSLAVGVNRGRARLIPRYLATLLALYHINILFSWLLTSTAVSMHLMFVVFLFKPFGPGCNHYEPNAPKTSITYDQAGTSPLTVASNKSLLGKGRNGGMYDSLPSPIISIKLTLAMTAKERD